LRLITAWIAAGFLYLAAVPLLGQEQVEAPESAAAKSTEAATPRIDTAVCLGCHGNEGFAMPGADGEMRQLHVDGDKFEHSVHGKRLCVECHTDINGIPHQKGVRHKVSCVKCHRKLWAAAQKENRTAEFAKLGTVVKQIERYMKSIHARPSLDDQSLTNATCYNCHNAHYVYPQGSTIRAEWRLDIPNICGKCHAKERDAYATSVHGQEVLEYGNSTAAICSDCHTTHDVDSPNLDSVKLVITKNCGNCHRENLKTYLGTYHGQVNRLGYAYTAKCFDCHGHHTIQRVIDPASTVSPRNRLETCRKCHENATRGFVSFKPHANTHDFKRHPYMWIASWFMIVLLSGVFLFFWTHSALWFYREYRDRRDGKKRSYVNATELTLHQGAYIQRFKGIWRIGHLCFAISVMMLVLTGMSVFYAESGWAHAIVKVFGGPKGAGIVHRTSAAIMLGIFFIHLVYFLIRIARGWKTWDWFGPSSLIPTWKDFADAIAMFKWFFGQGARPVFDRWTYWEKFDYWAVFWGMAIIGGSGCMLAFPGLTASLLPGWAFNVATLVHGEEAFLAAVFLFTVHFFNNHFRPDKLPPPDIVMFTGASSLEEFRREHTLEYERLAESGELENYLIDAPSRPMTVGSRILGSVLILFGLTLLALVMIGFFGSAGG